MDASTRLVMARLASGSTRLAEDQPVAPTRRGLRAPSFMAPRAPGEPSRFELGALGAALIGATVIGAALPHADRAQARPIAAVAAAPIQAAPIAAPAASSPATAATDTSASADDTSTASSESALATPDTAAAAPAAADPSPDDTSTKDTSGGDAATPGDEGDGSDPLAAGGDHLSQVALVVVHGDAPIRWRDAPAGSPMRRLSAAGTTYTSFAQVPGAPLASELGLIAGQQPNPATRAGCDTPTPLAPGTIDDLGRVAGTGCDYPAGTPSLPTAVAVDGRRWKAYAAAADAAGAAAALCGTGTPTGPAADLARVSALRRLADLSTSGACESAAAPLSSLAADLGSGDDAPAWMLIEVGDCGADGCDDTETAARETELSTTIATLTGKGGLASDGAVLVVGDGTASADGLVAADAGTVPAPPDDPSAPAPLLTGALLLGGAVAADQTDPLALDPFALARTQATWLGVDAPGWGKLDGTTALAAPSA